MKNNITEVVFIIDKSGSMSGLESDTIGGFNSMIDEQKEKEGKCYVSTVLFDSQSYVVHDRVDISKVKKMTGKTYRPGGSTALIDAMGDAIHHIANIHKYARPEDVPEKTIFIITTDGYENSSCRYTSDKVKKMVNKEKEEYGWEFIFIGANIDSVETAREYGIEEDRAVNYVHDRKGTHLLYQEINKSVSEFRACGKVNKKWKENLELDCEREKIK